jgi:hypothetical protein
MAEQLWLHVKVEERGHSGGNVNINLPLDIVETILPLLEIDELQNGKLRLDIGDEIGDIDLREVLAALRDTPDTTFIRVQDGDDSVRVAKEDGFLVILVDEGSGRSAEHIRVRVPLAVAEALIGGNPDELDLVAALRVLSEFDGEDIVRVESEDSLVRIWIDDTDAGL